MANMDYVSYVPPLTPDMIPEGCYPHWDMEKKVWTFPIANDRPSIIPNNAYIPPETPAETTTPTEPTTPSA
jgi:hypothetical protein